MSSLEIIKTQLEQLNYKPKIKSSQFNNKDVLVFNYDVVSGQHKDKTFKIGISMQEEGYPEYPPHFIHIYNIQNTNLTIHNQYTENGGTWKVFSVPPSDIWDKLRVEEKNMKTFLHTHLVRIWDQI